MAVAGVELVREFSHERSEGGGISAPCLLSCMTLWFVLLDNANQRIMW